MSTKSETLIPSPFERYHHVRWHCAMSSPKSMADGVGMNHDHDMDMDMDMDMMSMHNSFYWGKDAIILFSGWPNGSLGMYIIAVFCVFLMAVAAELLSAGEAVIKPHRNPMLAGLNLAIVHTLRMGLAYLVMLSLMSFNLGVFVAALVGHALGFFIFKASATARPADPVELDLDF